ncbi:hypothetical protein [Pseudoalteromonas ulvae]|uniref:Lipoprotein n=1 Tax=Pseudoalteromonas ulvae TaxID=107327 RepID=A0A244CL90_PSEDV|nr:hypothetical protein [Pseudoalteromonas ulvae]OUL56362.1 hypothetical protein B1199_16940 [Pseudoalteromonas ulvae]
MKSRLLCVLSALTLTVSGCSLLPIETDVKEGFVRIKNQYDNTPNRNESIFLFCHNQRVIEHQTNREYPAGQHNLWVMVNVADTVHNSAGREAVVNFNVDLPAGKKYILNGQMLDQNAEMAVWIEDFDNAEVVSPIVKTSLKNPSLVPYQLRKKQCESSSV